MISAILFISFFIFLILGIPIGILPRFILDLRNFIFRHIADDRCHQHVFRHQ